MQQDKAFTTVLWLLKYVSVLLVLYAWLQLRAGCHLVLCCLLQADILALRLMQDVAFQQAVHTSHVHAAAKAAVSLLGVRIDTTFRTLDSYFVRHSFA